MNKRMPEKPDKPPRSKQKTAAENDHPPGMNAETRVFSRNNTAAPNQPQPDFFANLDRQVLGDYEITGFLGRGGTALVYAAKDADGDPIALKVMEETPLLPAVLLSRFRREAEATKKLRRHPNIVTIYDTGCEGTSHYIAMEQIAGGGSLEKVLEKGWLPIDQALRIGLQVAKALDYAHSEGIVHRDLKPANVLLSEFGEPILADFGLARVTAAGEQLTLTHSGLGTPQYMSPEQTHSSRVGAASDIYSFGIVLYEMLTGRKPYTFPADAGMGQMFDIIRHIKPVNPRKVRKEISRNLAAVVLTLLEKDPELRYQDMSEVAADLQACSDGKPVRVRRPGLFERMDRWVRSHKAVSAVSLSALTGFFALWTHFQKTLQQERRERVPSTLETAAKDREIERLKRLTAAPDTTAPQTEFDKQVEYGHLLILNGDTDVALNVFHRLLAQAEKEEQPGYARTAARELARASLAASLYSEAAAIFQELSEQDVSRFGRQLAAFEHGIALRLAGERDDAENAWRTLKNNPDLDPKLLNLCVLALNPETHGELVDDAVEKDDALAALTLWLAAQGTEDNDLQKQRRLLAHRKAAQSLPWLHAFLTQ